MKKCADVRDRDEEARQRSGSWLRSKLYVIDDSQIFYLIPDIELTADGDDSLERIAALFAVELKQRMKLPVEESLISFSVPIAMLLLFSSTFMTFSKFFARRPKSAATATHAISSIKLFFRKNRGRNPRALTLNTFGCISYSRRKKSPSNSF